MDYQSTYEFTDFERKLMSMVVSQAADITSLQSIVKELHSRIDAVQTMQVSADDVQEQIDAALDRTMSEQDVKAMIDEEFRDHEILTEDEVERIATNAAEEALRDNDVTDIDEKIADGIKDYFRDVKLSVNIED